MVEVYKLAEEEYELNTDEYYIRVSDGRTKIWCYVGELTDRHARFVLGELRRKDKKNNGQRQFKIWTLPRLTDHWQLREEQGLTAKLKDKHPDWDMQKIQQDVLNTLLDCDWEGRQLRFRLSLDNQDLTDEQQEILSVCVCAANRVKVAAGYGHKIIANKYAPKFNNNEALPNSAIEKKPVSMPSKAKKKQDIADLVHDKKDFGNRRNNLLNE